MKISCSITSSPELTGSPLGRRMRLVRRSIRPLLGDWKAWVARFLLGASALAVLSAVGNLLGVGVGPASVGVAIGGAALVSCFGKLLCHVYFPRLIADRAADSCGDDGSKEAVSSRA